MSQTNCKLWHPWWGCEDHDCYDCLCLIWKSEKYAAEHRRSPSEIVCVKGNPHSCMTANRNILPKSRGRGKVRYNKFQRGDLGRKEIKSNQADMWQERKGKKTTPSLSKKQDQTNLYYLLLLLTSSPPIFTPASLLFAGFDDGNPHYSTPRLPTPTSVFLAAFGHFELFIPGKWSRDGFPGTKSSWIAYYTTRVR